MELKTNNIKSSKAIYAIAVIVSAIIFPIYFLSGSELSAPNTMQWILIILYSTATIGFALMVTGIKVTNITSEETDKKIIEKKAAIDKALKPYLIILVIGLLIWATYLGAMGLK